MIEEVVIVTGVITVGILLQHRECGCVDCELLNKGEKP
jgi:hypothetical protein